ncbi:MAG: glycerate kinase [Victivallales bacterium]|nr:glycerate kinase [Victivallales bacterium]
MRIVIAPDSFKGTLRSSQVCDIVESAFMRHLPDAEIVKVPLSDGGEGFVQAIINTRVGSFVNTTVLDPLGREIKAEYALLEDSNTAIIEMASASGIELLGEDELNPMLATSFGTGQLIRHAILESGAGKIIIGLGGSATVDGGLGMAEALGYTLLDSNGKPVKRGGRSLNEIAAIQDGNSLPEVKRTCITAACDVNNFLVGPRGAVMSYAPQKGANGFIVPILEQGMNNLLDLWTASGMIEGELPGDGAAGGIGAALRAFCGADLVSGAELVCEITGIKSLLAGAGMLITGEGCTDQQTLSGKLCHIVAKFAKAADVPVILISGSVKLDNDAISSFAECAFECTKDSNMSIEKLKANAESNLASIAEKIARIIKMSSTQQQFRISLPR